ncbi:hypothetical protein ACWENQ_36915 [Nonomuraea sp. NPDC004354]
MTTFFTFSGFLTRRRHSWPASRNATTAWEPMKPDAPVTNTRMLWKLALGCLPSQVPDGDGESFRDRNASHRCPATAPDPDPEVVMIVGAVIAAAVLVCTCSVVVLRRRSRSRG